MGIDAIPTPFITMTDTFHDASLQRFIDDLPMPFMIYRLDGFLCAMNQAAEQFWSVQREQMLGIFNVLRDPQSVAQGVQSMFDTALAGETFYSEPVPYDTALVDVGQQVKKQLWIRARIFSLRDAEHRPCYVVINHEDVTAEIAQRAAIEAARDEIAAQRSAIQVLSSPIIQLWDGVLTVPLVGTLDARRAMFVTESLLDAIVAHQSDIVIIDITGVPVVDTAAASALLMTARAVGLLGSRVVLVGVSAEVAQTLVHLGVDLSLFEIQANLQAGVAWAFTRLGFKVVAV
jgi:anti-anti-sigma factor